MKQVIALLMMVCLMQTAAADQPEFISLFGAEDEEIALRVEAEDGLTVLSTHVVGELDYLGFYAELRNDGDIPVQPDYMVCIGDCSLEMSYEEQRYDCSPWIVQPGQTAYFYGTIPLDSYCEDKGLDDLSMDVLQYVRIRCFDGWSYEERDEPTSVLPVTATVEEIEPPECEEWVWKALRVTIVNASGEDFCDPEVAIGAYDAQGRLLFVARPAENGAYRNDDMLVIPDGGSLIIDRYVHYSIGEDLEACNLEIAEYRCIVY